jgi:hypothetical protein
MSYGPPVRTVHDPDGTGRNVIGTRALPSASYSF